MKKIFAVFLLMNCLIFTGCFQGETGLNFDSSGKITFHNKIIGIPYAANQIEEVKSNLVKNNPNAKVESVTQGNFSGYNITIEYPNIEKFNEQSFNLYTAKQGKSTGIQKTNNWFYDSYTVDLFIEGKKSTSNSTDEYSQLGESMAQTILSQAKFDLVITIPYSADSNNADITSNDGKTFTWNIVNSLVFGQDRQIKLNFKVWNIGCIIITFLGLFAVIGIIVRYVKKSKKIEDIES